MILVHDVELDSGKLSFRFYNTHSVFPPSFTKSIMIWLTLSMNSRSGFPPLCMCAYMCPCKYVYKYKHVLCACVYVHVICMCLMCGWICVHTYSVCVVCACACHVHVWADMCTHISRYCESVCIFTCVGEHDPTHVRVHVCTCQKAGRGLE